MENRLKALLENRGPHPPAQHFATHLAVAYLGVFTVLLDPVIDATNWRPEHALRRATVTRKD